MALSHRVSDLRSYELLADIADAGSISAAARRHRVSQAAVSARMRDLERALRVPLLARSAVGATLTPAGADVLARAAPLLEAARALDAHLDAIPTSSPVLRVAASSTIAEHLLPAWLTALRRHRPQVRIEARSINTDAVLEALRTGAVDVGFTEDGHPPAGTHHRVVDHDELVVVVAPHHGWARRASITAAELGATTLITRERGSGARRVLEARLGPHRDSTASAGPPRTELSSNTAIKNAAVSGLGIAVLSSLVVAGELASGLLDRVHVEDLDLRRELHAVWSGDRAASELAVALVATIP